jgi:short-subunit dehydrogenase
VSGDSNPAGVIVPDGLRTSSAEITPKMGRRRNLRNARLLIAGASQGIGRSLARSAAARGARVLAAARSLELLQQLQREVRDSGHTLEIVQADVTRPADRQRLVDAALQHFGGLDVLVNNAGVGAIGPFADCAPERLRAIMEVNFFGLTETTRLFLPLLKQGNRPAIVNVSSVIGKRAVPRMSEYCASKFAVQGFSEALRAELDKDGVDVLVVCPGRTHTHFHENLLEQRSPQLFASLGGGQSADRVAAAALRALERGKHEICLTVSGKLMVLANRFMPRLLNWFFARQA